WSAGSVPGAGDNVTIPGAPANQPVLDAPRAVHDLTIQAGASLDLAGQNFTASGAISNDGTVKLQGSQSVSITANDSDSGTWLYAGTANATADSFPIKDFGAGTDYFNLVIQADGLAPLDTFQAGAALTVAGTVTVTAGTLLVNGSLASAGAVTVS